MSGDNDPLPIDSVTYRARYRALRKRGMTIARSFRLSNADAEDVVQDALVKLLRVPTEGHAAPSRYESYFDTTVRNLCIDFLRKHGRESALPEPEDMPGPSRSERHDQRILVREVLAALPDSARSVLVKSHLEGRSVSEIATQLGISSNAASAMLYRARRAFRDSYVRSHVLATDNEQCAEMRMLMVQAALSPGSEHDIAVTNHRRECDDCENQYAFLLSARSAAAAALAPGALAALTSAGVLGFLGWGSLTKAGAGSAGTGAGAGLSSAGASGAGIGGSSAGATAAAGANASGGGAALGGVAAAGGAAAASSAGLGLGAVAAIAVAGVAVTGAAAFAVISEVRGGETSQQTAAVSGATEDDSTLTSTPDAGDPQEQNHPGTTSDEPTSEESASDETEPVESIEASSTPLTLPEVLATIAPSPVPTVPVPTVPAPTPSSDPAPSAAPSESAPTPSQEPSPTASGDPAPSSSPSPTAGQEPSPTEDPTEDPTQEPTEEPTEEPTQEPTEEPTEEPTQEPTEEPTQEPTQEPTEEPTEEPTQEPTTEPTEEPTSDTPSFEDSQRAVTIAPGESITGRIPLERGESASGTYYVDRFSIFVLFGSMRLSADGSYSIATYPLVPLASEREVVVTVVGPHTTETITVTLRP